MASTRYYKYEFSDGSLMFFSPEEAEAFLKKKKNIHTIFDGYKEELQNPPRIRDGFKPGYQHSLGREVSHYDEYKRICKERGCIIGGNDKPSPKKKVQKSKYVNDSTLKNAVERGAKISGNEASALKKGVKFHRD